MPVFEHLRISLAKWSETPFFQYTLDQEPARDRREVLTDIFGQRRDFVHRGKKVTFLPTDAPRGFVGGYFAREFLVHGYAPQGDHFVPEDVSTSDLSFLALDMGEDQQVAAMQKNSRVGDPRAVLESFFASAPVRSIARDYQVHIKYLTSEESYYEAAEKYKGKITRVIFKFIPPNALKSEEKVAIFIKEASEDANSELLKHEYENRDGNLNPAADLLAGSEKVSAAGGGETIMKSGKRTVFRSTAHRITSFVDKNLMPDPQVRLQIMGFVNHLLGKSND